MLRSLLEEIRATGQRNLMIVPHPHDLQSAHKAATEITLAALCPNGGGEDGECGHIDWDVWYYQSPWFTIPAGDIDVVVSLDEADMATKKAAAAQHKSQLDRTPYTDFVESAGHINADLLPELLLGFGLAKFQQFGSYCEVYQTRMREFYHPDEPDVVVYQHAEERPREGEPRDLLEELLGLNKTRGCS